MNQKAQNRFVAAIAASLMTVAGFVGGRMSVPADREFAAPLESRSPEWREVRAAYIALHPVCEACGTKDDLNVHHVIPFSTDAGKELDPQNLITLCAGRRHCHLRIGHSFNFQCYNPHVREDAALMRKRMKERLY